MANNNDWLINLVGKLDPNKTKKQINDDIEKIQGQLNDVELKAKLGSAAISDLEKQLNNLQVTLTDVTIPQSTLDGLVNQINNALRGVQIPNININPNIGGKGGSGSQVGQVIADDVKDKLEKVMSDEIDVNFRVSDTASNDVKQELTNLVKEWTNGKGNVISVSIDTQTAFDSTNDGRVEKLKQATIKYANEVGETITKTLRNLPVENVYDQNGNVTGVVNRWIEASATYKKTIESTNKNTNNFVNQQKNAVSDLTNTLNQVYKNGTDKNAPKPIKDTAHLSNLKTKYDEIENAIANMGNASVSAFTDERNNVKTLISELKIMVSEYRNAETAATSMRSKDITTIKIDETNNLDAFVQKMEQSGHYTDDLKQKVTILRGQLNSVFDTDSLTKYLNGLSNLQSEFKAVDATAKTVEKATKIQTNVEAEKKILTLYKNELKESGVLTGDVKQKIQDMFHSLSKVDSQNGLTTWRAELKGIKAEIDAVVEATEKFNKEQKSLNQDKSTELSNFRTLKDKWDSQGLLVDEFRAKVEAMESSLSSVGSKGELDNLKIDIKDLKTEATQLLEANKAYEKAEKELAVTLEKRRAAQANSAKEKAKSNAQQELAQQREVNAILSKQESAYKEIWNINKQIANLDPTKNSNQISALNEKKKFYQEIYLSAQKELQAYSNITVSQEHLNSLSEIRKKTEAEISVIQGKQADVDVASKATSKEKAYQDAYTALKKLYDLRIEYAKIDNPSNNATYLYENAIKQQEQVWRKAYANTSEPENWDMQKRLELERQEIAMQEKLAQAYGRVTEAKKQAEDIDKIQHSLSVGDYDTQLKSYSIALQKAGVEGDELNSKLKGASEALDKLRTSATGDDIIPSDVVTRANTLINEFEKLANVVKNVKLDNTLVADDIKVNDTITKLNEQLRKNSNYATSAKDKIKEWIRELESGDVAEARLRAINSEAKRLHSEMAQLGKIGKSTWETLTSGARSFFEWTISSISVMEVVQSVKTMVTKVIELDTALVDLTKTANMSKQELKDFYYASSDIAKQMGVGTKEIIEQASAWSRLGFNTAEAATQMAKLSSQFKLISPGMTTDEATDGLVSIMKAYDIDVSNVLDGIMSKVNIIGNKFALSNSDIIAMLQDSVSAMAEGNNTLEETIALETAAFEIAQDRSVGNGFKTVALRLRGINEETQEFDDSLKTIKGDLYDLTGVSVMQDADTFKSTYQILKDINTVWDDLSDKTQANNNCLYVQKCA